jgi:hypothetical protein
MLMSSRPDRHNNIRFVWCVQVIIFCTLGLFEEPIILLRLQFCFLEWYVIACRSPSHEENRLQAMDDSMVR